MWYNVDVTKKQEFKEHDCETRKSNDISGGRNCGRAVPFRFCG